MSIEPDAKDWTWVVDRPCRDCGFDPATVAPGDLPGLLLENTRGWYPVLADADFAVRPAPHVWSRLEYACHVRDVHRILAERVRLMLAEDDPEFESWDQDAMALDEVYGEQDPAVVGTALVERGAEAAALYASVTSDQWQRTGRRSDGSVLTVETNGRCHLHEVVHHLWDVTITPSPDLPEA